MTEEASSGGRERRTSNRRSPRSGVRIVLRAGTMGLGPDIATRILDVSEDGLCVELKSSVAMGSEAEVILQPVGSGKPKRFIADVRWCVGDAQQGFRVGLKLRRRLPYKELMDLARS